MRDHIGEVVPLTQLSMGQRQGYRIWPMIAWTETGIRTATADVVPGAPRPAKPDEAYRLARM